MPRLTILIVLLCSPTLLPAQVDYVRDIKPILTRRCLTCHGPLKQRSGLRLDTVPLMLKGGDSGPAIVPGKAETSRLVKLINGTGKERMPPEGKPLEAKEIQLIRQWIKEGARAPKEVAVASWRQHWAYQSPKRPRVPTVKNKGWVKNPIDAFVAAQLAEHKLKANQPASKEVLLRRVYLDLIGLPPTRNELQTFLNDTSPDAYEKVVDHLLKSPHYGERWGRHWMDVWRYSDWYGRRGQGEIRYSQYHIWRWRDWIIESLNADKGYDRMIIEMLAGDEIAPGDPKILPATGFVARNWYKFDRDVWMRETVEHTAMGFLGLTLKCARCHDHKYDPIPQTDYYAFRAFFEPHDIRLDPVTSEKDLKKVGLARIYDAKPNTPTYLFERGDDRYPDKKNPLAPAVPKSLGNSTLTVKPITLPVDSWYPALRPQVVKTRIEEAENACESAKKALAGAEKQVANLKHKLDNWRDKPKPAKVAETPRTGKTVLADNFAKPRPDLWKIGHGKWDYQNGHLRQSTVTQWAMITSKQNVPQNIRAKVRYKTLGGGTYNSVGISFDVVGLRDFQAVYTSISGNRSSVQAFHRKDGKEHYPPSGIFQHPLKLNEEITLDIAVRDQLLNVRVNGELKIVYRMPMTRQKGVFALWNHSGTAEFYEVNISELPDDVQLVNKTPNGKQAVKPKTKADYQQLLEMAKRDKEVKVQQEKVANISLQSLKARNVAERAKYASPPNPQSKALAKVAAMTERQEKYAQAKLNLLQAQHKWQDLSGRAKNDKARAAAEKQLTAAKKAKTVAEMALKKDDAVYSPLGKHYPKTSTGRRLALARWIADAKNPRTARVAINHIWLRHFGKALIASTANFGLSGKQPTHPQLLDWLATELTDNNWSTKHIHRLIVTSNTYCMSSDYNEANAKLDPENRYLWRMNWKRMEAEVVRDSLLRLGDKLDKTMGGPELSQKLGQSSTRRSVYFRVTPDDKMELLELFDLANPTECYQRQESVVPQQSLALLNSAIALSQSRFLARTLSKELVDKKKDSDTAFVTAAFEQVLGRQPTATENTRCVQFLRAQSKLLANSGKLTPFPGNNNGVTPPSTAPRMRARENLVHVLFNGNEFVTIR